MNKWPVVKLVCCERSVRLDIEPIYAARVDGGGERHWPARSGDQPDPAWPPKVLRAARARLSGMCIRECDTWALWLRGSFTVLAVILGPPG